MKRRNETRRRGVVLLLILGLMAMFAISVLSYMVVTTNMAETARNAQKNDSVFDQPSENDVDAAIRNLVVGTNNPSNPIGPFGVLENMYGDWTAYEAYYDNDGNRSVSSNDATQFQARVAIFPNLGYAVLTPVTDFYGNTLINNDGSSGENDYYLRQVLGGYFENSGNVLTFMSLDGYDGDWDATTADEDWKADVADTSTYVMEKVITNPSAATYGGANSYWLDHYLDNITESDSSEGAYDVFDYWHFKVELSDDLKKFVDDFCENGITDINGFNLSHPLATVRLNRPAYSGTGVGGFAPGLHHDSTFDPDMIANDGSGYVGQLRLPYAFWMNASAPDMWPFYLNSSAPLSFRSLWAHLTDVNYDPTLYNDGGSYYYGGWSGSNFTGASSVSFGYNGDVPDPVRVNPSYTAPDARTPFLAHLYSIDDRQDSRDFADDYVPYASIIPSFHRVGSFESLTQNNPYGSGTYLQLYRDAYSSVGVTSSARQDAYLSALLRKLTPRPLPLDHWNFTGGNPDAENFYYYRSSGNTMTPEDLAWTLGHSLQWDVDNDNDGIREGIWIPSGLPIRYDQNGTPYATLFSYTVLDLDGRVNVNTAGNWDQLPNKLQTQTRVVDSDGNNTYVGNSNPFNYVNELDDLWDSAISSSGVDSSSPFFYADDLDGGIGWNDDLNYSTNVAERGEGRGATNVVLYEALAAAFDTYVDDEIQTIASNLLWRRNMEFDRNPLDDVDMTNLSWGVYGLSLGSTSAPQPGYNNGNSEADDSIGSRSELLKFIDPVFLTATTAEVMAGAYTNNDNDSLYARHVVFPWRGKTTIDMNTVSGSAIFDFADTAFRSYDPLGMQIYTYAPRYSNNPYLAYQNALSINDSPYSLPMLERLLRPNDGDSGSLPPQLVNDLKMNSDFYSDLYADGGLNDASIIEKIRERAKARLSLTTLSNDVVAASVVFPENFEDADEVRYGNYGFVDLIRRNVRAELRRVFETKGICKRETEQDGDGNDVEVPGTNLYLDDPNGSAVFERKVDEITAYLASMLPKEILAGEKIDLNALAQKNYWLDVDYDSSGNLVEADRALHNEGLVKRMEFARGLYLVVMTLLYDDMNAEEVYDPEGNLADEDKLHDYIEGSLDLLTFKGNDKAKGLVGRELMATRIAQWCVNVVDFSDPDATMTPFFFDPTPFDGWWVTNVDGWWNGNEYSWIDGKAATDGMGTDADGNPLNRWEQFAWGSSDDPDTGFLFSANYGLPTDQMRDFFVDALNGCDAYKKADDTTHSVYPLYSYNDGGTINYFNSIDLVAKWLSKEFKKEGDNYKIEDPTTDLGFRVVWGMERPDLVLTETLNFHDLGIADTEIEFDGSEGYGNGSKVADDDSPDGSGDETYDQVRRPQGSSYLELYCTANPNVPQSPELYDYIDGSWKLRLSKMTPSFTDQQDSERSLEFPVWRVAISDSSDPRGLNELKTGATDDEKKAVKKSSDSVYHKARNSVLEWFIPHKDGEDYVDDLSFFSMQPRQFRNSPVRDKGVKIWNISNLDLDQGTENGDDNEVAKSAEDKYYVSQWKDYNDVLSSNVLGSAFAKTYKNSRLREVELDRILWFAYGERDGGAIGTGAEQGSLLGNAGAYPDALRTFCNKSRVNVYLKPNQYLVVGPEKERSVGFAVAKAESDDKSNNEQQFGQPLDKTKYASSYIDIANLPLPGVATIEDDQKYQYMEAVSNIGERGFNISEPLWTASNVDPYYAVEKLEGSPNYKINNDASFYPGKINAGSEADVRERGVRDMPFEMPDNWADRSDDAVNDPRFQSFYPEAKVSDSDSSGSVFYDNCVANYPIVKDEIFGLGTIPGYKSAFVQRVADPNRPYHPVLNPYITVDWNMMDLTVFTGESASGETLRDSIDSKLENLFSSGDNYGKSTGKGGVELNNSNNRIALRRDLTMKRKDSGELFYKDAFSSRQWGSKNQKMFAPNLNDNKRPNAWSRNVKAEDKAGLEAPETIGDSSGTLGEAPAMCYLPKHTLGFYNDHGKRGTWTQNAEGVDEFVENDSASQYKNLNADYIAATGDLSVYRGAPRLPFEHLVWNDAPFGNPYELMLVPASSPGRFGLEFARRENELELKKLYEVKTGEGEKGALGSRGLFGFDDWYTDENIKIKANGSSFDDDDEVKKLKGQKAGCVGSYLNFFASSKKAGNTLNLGRLLDLVTTPCYYLGTRKLAGEDSNGNYISDELGNTLIYPAHRIPGKVNINTTSLPAWHGLVNATTRYINGMPGTPWSEFQNGRYAFESFDSDDDGDVDYTLDLPYTYFQPSYTTPLWIQMDGSSAPVASYSTLLAQQTVDTRDEDSVPEEPLFDSTLQRYAQDSNGNTLYKYVYFEDDGAGGETENEGETSDLAWLQNNERTDSNPSGAVKEYSAITTERRGNLYDATSEMQRLSGVTTNRSNVFAAWVTVGYFEVERCNPGVNMPDVDPDGNTITLANLVDPNYKWYYYYQAIYPDGYTYGKELGEDYGEARRHRGFTIIDRSIPVDFRRGNSVNYENVILLKRLVD